MGENSSIEWCHHTFNGWLGCTKVAAGCANCYAERDMDKHYHKVQWGPHGTRVKTSEANWRKPLKWNREAEAAGVRAQVFCASLADVFELWDGPIHNSNGEKLYRGLHNGRIITGNGERAPGNCASLTLAHLRADLFALIDSTPWLDWLLLTKRPENIRRMWCSHVNTDGLPPSKLFRRNVWLLTSVAEQCDADRNVPELLKCRDLVPVLGVSAEPLVGPIDLTRFIEPTHTDSCVECNYAGERYVDTTKFKTTKRGDLICPECGGRGEFFGDDCEIDWLIVGGESGPNARPMHPEWARSLRDQCQAAGVAFHFKQWGEWAPCEFGAGERHDPPPSELSHYFDLPPYKVWRFGKKAAGRLLDGREWNEYPVLQSTEH